MVWEVVVVFDWLEGGGFSEKAEVVDCDWDWEEGLKSWRGRVLLVVEGVG